LFSQLNMCDEHDRAARAELHTRARLNLRRFRDTSAIEESAEARIGIDEQAAPVTQPELGVAARNHRPLRLIEDDLTLSRVTPDFDRRSIKHPFGTLLPVALFCQNDFHVELPFVCCKLKSRIFASTQKRVLNLKG
jgi:hypothetical protein